MHAYLINRVGAGASSQKWCDSNNCECRWRRLWASAMFGFQKAARDSWWKVLAHATINMPTTVTAAVQLCMEMIRLMAKGHLPHSSPLPQRDPSSFCYSTLALRTSATLQMFTFLFPSLNFFLSFSLLLLLSRVSWPLPFLPLQHHHHLYCWIQTGYLYLSAWLLHLPLP